MTNNSLDLNADRSRFYGLRIGDIVFYGKGQYQKTGVVTAYALHDEEVFVRNGKSINAVFAPTCTIARKVDDSIQSIVEGFQTRHIEGFTDSEWQNLLKNHFPEIAKDEFQDSLIRKTCKMVGDDSVHYHHDIIYVIDTYLANRMENSNI